MEKSVGVVLMLDVSGSMYYAMEQLKINTNAFLNESIPGDQFAINAFDYNARWVCPTSSEDAMISITSGRDEVAAAAAEIEKLAARGNTNITDAIRLGNGMIKKAATDIKAFVMLSDGDHNASARKPEEELENNPPLYVAGLGDCREAYFAKMFAKNPLSKFYYQPRSFEMMYMFNQIRADASNAVLVANKLHDLAAGSYFTMDSFTVAKDAHSIVSITWPSKSYIYTPGTAKGNQIYVALIDPDNKRLSLEPTIVGAGFCIFELKDVKPGSWRVMTEYSTPQKFTATVGVMDRNPSIRTSIKTPAVVNPDQPITVDISVGDGISPCENTILGVHIVKHEIVKSEAEENLQGDEAPADLVFSSQQSKQLLTDSRNGCNTITIDNTSGPGIYTVEIDVEGIDKESGLRFTQRKMSSILVR